MSQHPEPRSPEEAWEALRASCEVTDNDAETRAWRRRLLAMMTGHRSFAA